MPSKARLLAKSMIESPILSEITTNPTVTPTTITTAVDDVATGNFASIDLLPNTGNDVGDLAFVRATDRLYIWSGEGWYNIALVNTTPTWDSGGQPAGSYVLDADSPQTATTITLAASDPEGFSVSYNYVTGGSMDSIATISQDSSVFTITPKTSAQAPDGGTGTITFRATDGTNILPQVSSFTLTFPVDWSSITQQAQIQASDADGYDDFGNAISITPDGGTIIVGAHRNDTGGTNNGAAYIFTLSGSTWSQQAQIQAADAGSMDEFGKSVDISENGNTAIVGSWHEDTGGSNAGAAYIFTRSGTSWSQQAKIQHSGATQFDQFGSAVSITNDGNMAIIGAQGYDDQVNFISAGGAYIFTRSGTSWSQQAQLLPSNPTSGDEFGWGVSISKSNGDTAIVGSPKEDTGSSNAGSAYIYTRSGTSWSQQAQIQASDRGSNDNFGNAVSISDDGNTAIIGSPYEDSGATNTGAAYIFTRSGTTWSQQAKIQASDLPGGGQFGMSVDIKGDGDTVAVGAQNANNGAGYAYIFTRSGSSWTQEVKIQASNAGPSDQFGCSIAISESSVVVGAYSEDTTADESGSAYIFS
tara:strand:+ start:101 stop:1855 length:1755 start_codon:yes stop_codon:yes gene_type:complete